MQTHLARLITMALAGACAGGSLAEDIAIQNAGFEDIGGQSPFNEFTFGPPNGWDLYDPLGMTDGGDGPTFFVGTLTPFEADPESNPGEYVYFPDGAAEGERVAIAFNFAGSGNTGEYGIVQMLADTLAANTTYTLQVEIGNIASGTAISGQFFDLDGFPGYRVDLLAGDVVISQDDNTLAGAIPEGVFATSTVEITIGDDHSQLGEPLSIRLVNLNVIDPVFPSANLEVDFDDVRLSTTPRCAADTNLDGDVGLADLLSVLSCWGSVASGDCAESDVNDNGIVDLGDLLGVLSNWGGCPEPARRTRS